MNEGCNLCGGSPRSAVHITQCLGQRRKDLVITKPDDYGTIKVQARFGVKIFNDEHIRKEFKQYMFHKKKRIQKKWDKRYGETIEVKVSGLPLLHINAVV